MKRAYVSLIATAFAAASLQALAASQADTTANAATSAATAEQYPVRTSDTGWAVPQSVQLDPQTVFSHGGSLRPGPHNRQISPAHGSPVASMARPENVPGRE
jgi:hypothetical protein